MATDQIIPEDANNPAAFTAEEIQHLADMKAIVSRDWDTFIEVGNILQEIKDSRLYKIEYSTFEEFCEKNWDMSKSRAKQMIAGAKVVKALRAGDEPKKATIVANVVEPTHESQVRPLTMLPEALQKPAWDKAVGVAAPNPPTARQVEQIVRSTHYAGQKVTYLGEAYAITSVNADGTVDLGHLISKRIIHRSVQLGAKMSTKVDSPDQENEISRVKDVREHVRTFIEQCRRMPPNDAEKTELLLMMTGK